MLKKPLIAAVGLAALAGCSTAIPTTHTLVTPPARTVSSVSAPHFTQAQLKAMRAAIPARLTPAQARKMLVQVPGSKVEQAGRQVKWFGSYGFYPYSDFGYNLYYPYSLYGGYYYPYSSYPYSLYGGSYWPYSSWWW